MENNVEIQESLKELNDIKFALDKAAVIFITNEKGIVNYVNDKFCELSMYSKEDLIGNTPHILNSGYHSKSFFADLWKTIKSGNTWRGEIRNKKKNGEFYWVDSAIVPVLDDSGKIYRFFSIRYDITSKKNKEFLIEKALKEKEVLVNQISREREKIELQNEKIINQNLKLTETGKIANVGYWELNMLNYESTWSNEMYTIFDLDSNINIPSFESFLSSIHPEDIEMVQETISKSLETKTPYNIIHRLLLKNGDVKYVKGKAITEYDPTGVPKRTIGILQDITEIQMANQELKKTLTEKEILIHEIQNRVKNNLQVIYSLINFKKYTSPTSKDTATLTEIQGKVIAMSLAYDEVFKLDNFTKIDFKKYISRIEQFHAKNYLPKKIHFDISGDSVFVNIDPAINCGIILSEIISNFMKHAYNQETIPSIKISFSQKKSIFLMLIKDNGIGFPDNIINKSKSGMGLQLIEGLVVQMKGKLQLFNEEGACYKISLKT